MKSCSNIFLMTIKNEILATRYIRLYINVAWNVKFSIKFKYIIDLFVFRINNFLNGVYTIVYEITRNTVSPINQIEYCA